MGGLLGDIEGGFSAVINGVEHTATDLESLVSKAGSELESLGIAMTGEVSWLVKWLIQAGEDPVSVISQLSARITKMGGDVVGTLEQLASGIMSDGLMGFAQKKVRQALTPMQEALQKNSAQGPTIAQLHQTTLTTMQTRLNVLTTQGNGTGMAWQGPSADVMNATFGNVSGLINNLSMPLESGNAQDRLNQICGQVLEAIVVIGSIVLVCELVVTVIVAIPGLLSGPGDLVILGGGGALMAETLEAIVILVGADLLAWLIGSIAIYVTNHPISLPGTTAHALVPSGPTLPSGDLTPGQNALVDQLFREFGGSIPKEVLQNLLRMLGTGVSLKTAAAMIRCLEANGYLNVSDAGSKPLDSNFNSAWEAIWQHINPNDLEGAWKDSNPTQVDPSTISDPSKGVSGGNHLGEVNDALQSVDNLISSLNKQLGHLNTIISRAPDPTAPNIQTLISRRTRMQNLLDSFTKLKNWIKSKIAPGSPPPNTWSDQGRLPLMEYLLEVSSCKVPGSQYYK
ncbi:MAG TPA: hypothetical protein VH593_03225 [Ktedonobacteraceae bacterium]|jgi:hypothetical protein